MTFSFVDSLKWNNNSKKHINNSKSIVHATNSVDSNYGRYVSHFGD